METALLLVEAIPQKLDAIVQLVRNGLCCVKDLQIGPAYLHDPAVTAKYYRFVQPLDQTTPLEIAICLCQFFAFVSVSKSGYGLMTKSGWFKLKRVQRLVEKRASSGDGERDAASATSDGAIDRIINESLEKERADANRCIFVGANVLAIGLSFFWLVCNSLHITQTNWVGGLQALIHALIVMEIGLAPLLCYMLKDGAAHLARSASILKFRDDFAQALNAKKKSAEQLLGYESYCWIREGGWSPFWEKPATSPHAGKKTRMEESAALDREIKQVRAFVEGLTHGDRRTASVKAIVAKAKDACEKDGRLDELSVETRWHGYLEYIYFVLNFIAFYGYMLGILTYYFDDAYLEGTYTGSLRLGYSNASADWGGNFAGDAMWTVEPVFILSTPMLLGWVKPRKATNGKAKVE